MRTAHGIYRVLQQYLEEADKNGFDEDIDMDFRSVSHPLANPVKIILNDIQGVLLGTGTSSLMLSLLPGKVLKVSRSIPGPESSSIPLTSVRSPRCSAMVETGKWPWTPSWPLEDGHGPPSNPPTTRVMRVSDDQFAI